MGTETFVILLNDGDKTYAVPAGDGSAGRKEAQERVDWWNDKEGYTATLGVVSPVVD